MYFLIHPRDLSVHEIEEDQVHVAGGGCIQSFLRTSASFKQIFMHSRFPECRVNHETLVFLRLQQGKGWVWASSICVANDSMFPVEDRSLGDNFFFIWPVPVAINAYLEIKEKRRRQIGAANDFFEIVMDHPPCFSFVPNNMDQATEQCSRGLPTMRKLTSQQLTIAQRFFVASLVPHASPFSTRAPADLWCAKLGQRDRTHFDAWRATHGSRLPTVDVAPPDCPSSPEKRRQVTRAFCAECPLATLPDELLEYVISLRVSVCLHDVDQLKAVVHECASISAQFGRATRSVVHRMLGSVVDAGLSLCGDNNPREPFEVQAIVHAAFLTLRHALMLGRRDWGAYLSFRRSAPIRGNSMASDQRHRLLWRNDP